MLPKNRLFFPVSEIVFFSKIPVLKPFHSFSITQVRFQDKSSVVNVVDLKTALLEMSSNQELPSGSNKRGSISMSPVSLAWECVTCTVRTSRVRCQKGGKILLRNITGMAEGGKIQVCIR